MKTDEIKIMLDAFYNGETTAAEELRLLEYFSSEYVADELLDEKEVFLSMYQAEPIDVPPALETKLENLIDNLASEEKQKAEINAGSNRKHLLRWVGSAAACIAVLISVTFYFNNKPDAGQPTVSPKQQTAENLSEADKKALKEAEDALILLSSNFNKGVNQLAIVTSSLDKSNEILNKTLNRKKDKES
ncbi:hypothetical protein [Dysgonomonas termitidis]|uniref:Anti-sigma factor n=1 Tax=Dysgonomonas termitidis TaxID=1516126 RepID=A0ABV9L028_9BACT